jgi:hypothetical protein
MKTDEVFGDFVGFLKGCPGSADKITVLENFK